MTHSPEHQTNLEFELSNEELDSLLEENTPKSRSKLHKFFEHIQIEKEKFESEHIGDPDLEANPAILRALVWAQKAKDKTDNYLLQSHLEDFLNSRIDFATDEAEAGDGSPGAGAYKNRFMFKNQLRSAQNRLKFGLVSETNPAREAFVPLSKSQNLFALYRNGQLAEIYEQPESLQDFESLENELVAGNPKEGEEIYSSVVNMLRDLRENPRTNNLTTQVLLKDTIAKFDEEHPNFYFDFKDLEKWGEDPNKLHPVVIAWLVMHNEDMPRLKEVLNRIPKPSSVSKERLESLAFPYQDPSGSTLAEYEYLVSPAMRYRIEKDFGLEISNLPIHAQAQFLKYLNSSNVESFEKVKSVIGSLKDEGLRSGAASAFFSCLENPEYAQGVLNLVEDLKDKPEDLESVISSYNQIVESSFKAEHYLGRINDASDLEENDIAQVAKRMQHKANEIVKQYQKGASKETLGLEKKRLLEAEIEVIGLASAYKNVSKEHPAKLESLTASELTEKLKKEIVETYRRARNLDRDYQGQQEVVEAQVKDLEHHMEPNSGAVFKLTRVGGKLMGFMYLQPENKDTLWVGGLTVRPEAQSDNVVDVFQQDMREEIYPRFNVVIEVLAEKESLQRAYGFEGFAYKKGEDGKDKVINEFAGVQFVVMERPKGVKQAMRKSKTATA